MWLSSCCCRRPPAVLPPPPPLHAHDRIRLSSRKYRQNNTCVTVSHPIVYSLTMHPGPLWTPLWRTGTKSQGHRPIRDPRSRVGHKVFRQPVNWRSRTNTDGHNSRHVPTTHVTAAEEPAKIFALPGPTKKHSAVTVSPREENNTETNFLLI